MRRYEIVAILGATTVRRTFKFRTDAKHHAQTLAEQGWKVTMRIVTHQRVGAA